MIKKIKRTDGGFFTARYDSPLGPVTLRSDGEYLVGVSFDGPDDPSPRGAERDAGEIPELAQTAEWLDLYFGGGIPDFTPRFRLDATPFCREVCEILLTIPYGETVTYGYIANVLAERRGIDRMSAQAVGGAVGRNPIAIVIPCHRVIGADGSLTGYGGGLDRKAELLKLDKKTVNNAE